LTPGRTDISDANAKAIQHAEYEITQHSVFLCHFSTLNHAHERPSDKIRKATISGRRAKRKAMLNAEGDNTPVASLSKSAQQAEKKGITWASAASSTSNYARREGKREKQWSEHKHQNS
jgi:hypothetical protein